ncbi:MAG TPA: hypothetical protein VG917_04735 [Patescibacteria group bacterium]|nr:hypothetical protein [Patescibacteria group bacterium]
MNAIDIEQEIRVPQITHRRALPEDGDKIMDLLESSGVEAIMGKGVSKNDVKVTRARVINHLDEERRSNTIPYSFLSSENQKPVGFMALNVAKLDEMRKRVSIEAWFTRPGKDGSRSIALLKGMADQLLSMREPGVAYEYVASPNEQSYAILANPRIQEFLKNKGFVVESAPPITTRRGIFRKPKTTYEDIRIKPITPTS